jgi:hypothetical protein
MTMEAYANPHTESFSVWLSRDGRSIVLELPGSRELRFQDGSPGIADRSHWDVLDQILRSTGR